MHLAYGGRYGSRTHNRLNHILCLSAHIHSPFPERGISSVAYCTFGYYSQLVVFTKRSRVCGCLSTINVNGYVMCAVTGCSLDSFGGGKRRAVLIVGHVMPNRLSVRSIW